jgi:hypothetical protein
VSAPRHLHLAEQLVAVLGIHSDEVPSQTLEHVAERLAQYEQTVEANAVVYLHADRLTVEPTTFSEDGHLRPLLADGEQRSRCARSPRATAPSSSTGRRSRSRRPAPAGSSRSSPTSSRTRR